MAAATKYRVKLEASSLAIVSSYPKKKVVHGSWGVSILNAPSTSKMQAGLTSHLGLVNEWQQGNS